MWDLFNENPWLLIPSLALLIPIFGVIFGTITGYLTAVRRAELETALKQDMLQRGMSADEIKTVVEATGYKKGGGCKSGPVSRP